MSTGLDLEELAERLLAAETARFRGVYAMLGLSVAAHGDGAQGVSVRGSDVARDLRCEDETKGGVIPCHGSGSPSTTSTPT